MTHHAQDTAAVGTSQLEPEHFPPTGGPSFVAEGPQYLIGGKLGEGILANCASGLCDREVCRDGVCMTAHERFTESGSYDYIGDPVSVVPLPAGLWLLMAAFGLMAGIGRLKR